MLESIFAVDEDRAWSEGAPLSRVFAEGFTTDFVYLKSGDLVDLGNSVFDGIQEWDAFSSHFGSCERCNA